MLGMGTLVLSAVALVASSWAASPGWAEATGNGAPRGAHYNLNVIGVSKDKKADMTNFNRHVIFVKDDGKTRINLAEGDDYQVLDGNGTDGAAAFQLPNPDPDNDGTTTYSVFARALGVPGGSATIATCAMAPGVDGILGTADDEEVCNTGEVTVGLTRGNGKSSFENVSKEMLYLWDVDLDGDGVVDIDRVNLFSDLLEGYYWDYDNNGLKLAQFRFYECSTSVGDGSGDSINDGACF
ncbi:MAG: hypothetical protein O2821_09480 [Chloroflexi bacterium]|nr:hypothetical protein [Chloroflexota bacterium]MDA1226575.1 hypothetical protein [Chloroflexota bacterium]